MNDDGTDHPRAVPENSAHTPSAAARLYPSVRRRVFCAHFWGHRGGVPGARFPYYADLLTGALSALGISAAFICIRLTKMLRDDVLLHKMYTKATDEREALLWQKAGRQAFWVVVPGLVLAALAAGYWSATVCMTLLGAALFTAVTTKALRFYYMRKF